MALNARFAMTRPQMPIVQAGGIAQKDWYLFFTNLWTAATEGLPQPAQVIDVSASPFSYQAVIRGQAHVGGGTVSAIEFSRDGITWYSTGQTQGFVQMDRYDFLRVTYSVLPTITYFAM